MARWPSAATPGSQQDFVVNVGDRVFFESDQTELSPQAIATLEKQAQWLQTYNRYPSPSKAMPTSAAPANTTSRSVRGAPSRCDLSSPRAASMPNRMRTISYGKERPVAVCNDISCWSQNRRAVTVLNASS
jgi:Outer membrane protein and related peptidoglycan-associated (lipo)proteins